MAVLRWWRSSRLELRFKDDVVLGLGAAELLEVLQWWRESGLQVNWVSRAEWAPRFMDLLSANGCVEVLEWMRSCGDVPLAWTARAMDAASERGLVDVLQWWKNSGLECRWTENALAGARKHGHAAVLDWWEKSGL
ncbi:hypothetical protein DFJ73DRAFT_815259, partial [Zopfochytrium polystomum]